MINRRGFLGSIAIPAGFAANMLENKTLAGAAETLEAYGNFHSSPEEMAQDEDFWVHVQHAFTVDRSVLNLNNGGVCPATAAVQDAQKRYLDFSNTTPVYSMWRVLEPQRETVRKKLARVFGCDPEEIALTRNASEGLQILQFGFDSHDSEHLPHNFTRDTVAYTGTHDNDTAAGWLDQLAPEQYRSVLDYVGGDGAEAHWDLIRSILNHSMKTHSDLVSQGCSF